MGPNHVFDVMPARATRLVELRAATGAGTYFPDAEAVAESLVGWVARPERFERPAPRNDSAAR